MLTSCRVCGQQEATVAVLQSTQRPVTIVLGMPPQVKDEPSPAGGSLKLHQQPPEGIPPNMAQASPLSPAMVLSPAMAAVRNPTDTEELTPTLPVSLSP